MEINAAILGQGTALSVEEAELEAPRTGEVLVEVKAAGVCHSDLHPARGTGFTRTPLVLGHEGAGIVRRSAKVRRGGGGRSHCLLLGTAQAFALPVGGARPTLAIDWSARLTETGYQQAALGCAPAARTWLTLTVRRVLQILR